MSAFSKTELELLAVHRSPVVRLEDICQPYLNLNYPQARDRAALNELGLPTFRMRDSRKAPLLVRVTELAQYIDQRANAATDEWRKSQV
jgi:hypothetical protein